MRRAAAALLAALAASGVAVSVAAQPADDKPVTLEWGAPAECPDTAYVERELARLLAGDPLPPERRMRARAEVAREAARWRVRIRTSGAGGAGDRSLDAESCRALADATALIVALAVDPARVAANRAAASATPTTSPSTSATSSSPSSSPSPSPSPSPSTSASSPRPLAPRPSAPPPPPPESASPPTVVSLGLGGVLDTATLPHATVGASARLGMLPGFLPWLRLEAGAALFLSASTGATTPPLGGDFDLRIFDAAACVPLTLSRWEVAPCAGADLAWIIGHGKGPTSPGSGAALMPQLHGGGALGYRLGSLLYVRADVALALAIDRPDFVVGGQGGGLVFRPAVLTARAGLGFEVRF